ncbi:MAG: GNAT family N-acetyltransferase [Alphaproteobacteria bacterium]
MRIEVIHPKELGAEDVSRWRALQAAEAGLASPYLTPDWTRIVGAARADARVCVLHDGQGYFPVQRISRFSAMGLGAPIADYQGVISAPDLGIDPRALCKALKVGRIDLSHVPVGQSILRRPAGADGSWIVDVSGGAEAYNAGLKQRRGEFVRQADRKLREFEREGGAPVFTANSIDASDFETMLTWKNAQLLRTGQPAIWDRPWVRGVVFATVANRDPNFSGVLCTLKQGDRLIAANYFLRAGRVLHDWIMVHDSAFDAYSPGVELARRSIQWAAENGFAEVDFGTGQYQYKRQLSTGQRMLGWGSVSGASLSGAIRRTEYAVRHAIERVPHPRLAALPGKAMRRLDLMRGLATA